MIFNKTSLPSKANTTVIKTIDMHTGGEPLRVVVDGYPEIKGRTVLEKRNYCINHLDHLRKSLMWEPRGHADMYGCLIVEANDSEAAFGIIFMHNQGYSTMCGHATIAIGKLAIELGWVKKQESEILNFSIDAPCGRLQLFIDKEKHVSFHCVPSFVTVLNQSIQLASGQKIPFDIAYGGAFYAYINAADIQLNLEACNYQEIIKQASLIKSVIEKTHHEYVQHPFESELSFLYGIIFMEPSEKENIDSRNVCVFADREVDRCPTGSGVSGRMALHLAKKEIQINDQLVIESITGSSFKGSIVSEIAYGPYKAVIPKVSGSAFVTGVHEFIINQDDPFKDGFFLR